MDHFFGPLALALICGGVATIYHWVSLVPSAKEDNNSLA